MLKELTQQYIRAFNAKDIHAVADLLYDTFALEDPVVKRIVGKQAVLKAIQGIFDSCQKLSFQAKNIYQDGQTTIIEFILQLDEVILTGTDVIEWNSDNKMYELRAYLDIPK